MPARRTPAESIHEAARTIADADTSGVKDFIFRLTDPAATDHQVWVRVLGEGDLGRAAQLAIDDMIAARGGDFAFPLFIDIHPAEDFPQVAAHYAASRERGASVN